MTTKVWVKTDVIWCDRRKEEVALFEERIYPSDVVPDTGIAYKVNARKCSLGVDCNLAGFACTWSGLNPNYDPFLEA